MKSKLLVVCASAFFVLCLSSTGAPAALAAGVPDAKGYIAAKPGTKNESKPASKPVAKPKPKKGKGNPGDDKAFNPQPEPPGKGPNNSQPKN